MQDNTQGMTDSSIDTQDVQNPLPASQEQGNTGSGTPIDDMIAQVDSYIKNPSLVTAQTLQQLKSDLMDLKSVIDNEESQEQGPAAQGPNPKGLVIAIGQHGGGK